MKKTVLCALLLTLVLAGCGKGYPEPGPFLELGGKQINAESTSVDEVLAILGGGYEYAEAVSCVYDGMDKTYTYPDAVVYTFPDGDGDRLMELYCTGGDVKTPAGISLGDSRDKVVQTYGDGFTEKGIVLAYDLKKPASADNEPASLYFELTGGKVSAIGITSEHRSE